MPSPQPWQAFQADLNRHTVRVYRLDPKQFRIDTTTADSHADVLSEQGLIQFGHTKGDPTRPQLKVAACVLDPLGLPVTCAVLPGNAADDPLYVPHIQEVHRSFGPGGQTFIGDSKMAALHTRAYLASTGDFYLCPLSEKQMSRQERRQRLLPVWQGGQALQPVYRPNDDPHAPPALIAEGFSFDVDVAAEVDGQTQCWTERRWLVRSVALAEGQRRKLHERLAEAAAELHRLGQRRHGKKRLDAAGLEAAASRVLGRRRVEGLLQVEVRTQRRERVVRGYGGKGGRVQVEEEHRLEVVRDVGAIAEREGELGWQVYAVNQRELPLVGVVLAYRGQYHIEGGWSRLKGQPLSLEPMYLQDETRMQGLVLLLMLAVRVLTLLEWQAREKLRAGGEKLRGIYPGQPGRQTDRPSAELLLEALGDIHLTVVQSGEAVSAHVSPLSPVQQKLLALWELPAELYQRLAALHCSEPPPVLRAPNKTSNRLRVWFVERVGKRFLLCHRLEGGKHHGQALTAR